MKVSAGTLLYRRRARGLEVLLVLPSGPAARFGWSVPKGLPNENERLEDTARRETFEETGVEAGSLQVLGRVDYAKSRKRVECFFGAAPEEAEPRAASWEVARACFVLLDEAREKLHADQRAFLDMLIARIAG
jgi:predicted NUDIX family NTP pyrophosphohydrolase